MLFSFLRAWAVSLLRGGNSLLLEGGAGLGLLTLVSFATVFATLATSLIHGALDESGVRLGGFALFQDMGSALEVRLLQENFMLYSLAQGQLQCSEIVAA